MNKFYERLISSSCIGCSLAVHLRSTCKLGLEFRNLATWRLHSLAKIKTEAVKVPRSIPSQEPRREKTGFFAYAKTKAQISFAVTAKLISAFVFATRIVYFLFFLYPKFQASSLLL